MSQALFELYKEALRRGHLAALQGRLEAALTAYEAAATIAPDRTLPHASVGEVLRRLNRPDEAEHAYDAALQRGPMDETALRGRAAARIELKRPVDAARDLEVLADVLERANRIPEACEAACAALELGDTRNRRLAVERLAGGLAGRIGDPGAAAALARAEPFLDPSRHTTPLPEPASFVPEPEPEPEPVAFAPEPEPLPEPVAFDPEPEPLPEPVAFVPKPEPLPEPVAFVPEPEPEPELVVPAAPALVDAPLEAATADPSAEAGAIADDTATPPIDVVAARLEAEVLLAAGEPIRARMILLSIARTERAAGRLDAALDACLIMVALDPADTAVQVELAAVQAARGWTDVARDKLALLTRLADLDADPDALAVIEGSSVARELASAPGNGRATATRP